MKLCGDNVKTLNDWRRASAWFLENSQFSVFLGPYDSCKKDSYIKKKCMEKFKHVLNIKTSLDFYKKDWNWE